MKTFKDNAGRTWSVALNIFVVKQVRGLLGVDLLDLGIDAKNPADGLLYRLIGDPVLLVDVLFAVCKAQADAAGVTDEQFAQAMAGDAIDSATKALLEELADFTPSPRDRARARRVIEATWQMIDRAQDVLDANAERELPRVMDEADAGTWQLVYEVAGFIGIDPGPLTLRELVWMAEGRDRRAWDHTSMIAAAALSAMRERMVDPARLNPYRQKSGRARGIPLTAENIGDSEDSLLSRNGQPGKDAGHRQQEGANMKRAMILTLVVMGVLAVLCLPGCGNVTLKGEALTAAQVSTNDAYTAYMKSEADPNMPGWSKAYLHENVIQWRDYVRSAVKDEAWGPKLPDEKQTAPPKEQEYD